MICANYFPRNFFAKKNFQESVHKQLEKIKTFAPEIIERVTKEDLKTEIKITNDLTPSEKLCLERIRKSISVSLDSSRTSNKRNKSDESNINSLTKTTYTSEDDEWIIKTRHFIYNCYTQCQTPNGNMEIETDSIENPNFLSKIELQDLIKLYEKDLSEANNYNNSMLEDFEQKIIQGLSEEAPIHKLKHDFDNCLVDLKLNFPEDEQFLAYLEKKQNEGRDLLKTVNTASTGLTGGKSACNNPSSKHKEKILIDDMVCYVCNDGDYTDEDLIVFCSVSNFLCFFVL